MDVAVCSHFAGLIASMLVFVKARSLRSLTFWNENVSTVMLNDNREVRQTSSPSANLTLGVVWSSSSMHSPPLPSNTLTVIVSIMLGSRFVYLSCFKISFAS